jgi:4-aminobutyrate aminotransferase
VSAPARQPADRNAEWRQREQRHVARVSYRYTELTIDHGQGSYVWDANGRRYLDFACGIATTSLGHAHPRVVEAVQRQVERLMHVSVVASHTPGIELAERLARLAPGNLDQVFFSNSGTEAVEGAIKLARYLTGRPALIGFGGGFHGRTYGALSLTTSKAHFRRGYEPFLPSIYTVPFPGPYHCPLGHDDERVLHYTFSALDELFAMRVPPDQVAAILVEPILGEGGYVVPPRQFLPELRRRCDEHGILLILDEVQTGFGRTGKMFASEHVHVTPDIMVVAKSIASGLPLSAIVSPAELMSRWEPAAHGSTFGGNPVACAAGIATLQVLEGDGLLANAAQKGKELMRRLRALQAGLPAMGDVRGQGLLIGVELEGSNGVTAAQLQEGVRRHALANGLIVLAAGPSDAVLRLIPPLNVSDGELEEGWAILKGALEEVLR